MLAYKVGRHSRSVADFVVGLGTRPSRETWGRLYSNLALAQLAQSDCPSARENIGTTVELGCRDSIPPREGEVTSGLLARFPDDSARHAPLVADRSDIRCGPRREQGLAGRTVELLDADTGEVVGSTTTDARGSCNFDVSTGLGLGRYRVRVVSADGHVREPVIASVLVLPRGDTFLTRVNLRIAPAR